MKVGTCHARGLANAFRILKKKIKTKIHVSFRKVYHFHLNKAQLKKICFNYTTSIKNKNHPKLELNHIKTTKNLTLLLKDKYKFPKLLK